MNSWKHIDMKQARNTMQNSLQIWDIAIHLEESGVTQNMYFYQEETQSAQFTYTAQGAINPFRPSTNLITAISRPVVFNLFRSIASLQERNLKIAPHLWF